MSAAAPAMTYANNTVAFADLLASNADRQQRMDQARQEQQETRTIKYADGNKGNHGTKGKIDGGKGNHGKKGEGKPGVSPCAAEWLRRLRSWRPAGAVSQQSSESARSMLSLTAEPCLTKLDAVAGSDISLVRFSALMLAIAQKSHVVLVGSSSTGFAFLCWSSRPSTLVISAAVLGSSRPGSSRPFT